ncbi:GH25 family lysozyme [Catenibacterium sp.]|uniref:GH25 family lysozyme n=1 Tax=Catenibacterium sp. TaxID=2049022 RepID=UPI002E7A54C1|nr:GH25 family lysozyme [Catenibacterium sp.]MEE0041461.1 GH25 family lysozyme [Catenibacterium sp.]
MKKLFMKFCVVVLSCFMVFNTAYLPSYAEDEMSYYEQNDLANSFRYTDGQMKDRGDANYAARATTNSGWPNDPKAICKGIDVSYHNGTIDWKRVKQSEVEYAIIRCGYGTNDKNQDDKKWEENVKGCIDNNIPYGVYLYSYADTVEKASSEADHAIRLLQGKKLKYPVYYDLEEDKLRDKISKQTIADIAQTFCDKLSAKGYTVGIYANKDWFTNYLTDSRFNNWTKWVAQYNTVCNYKGKYDMWQCSSTGRVPGISGNVDLNYSYSPFENSYGGGNTNNGGTTNKYSDGLNEIEGELYYFKNNRIDTSYSGLAQYGNEWYYIENGKVNWNYTGLAQRGIEWFYIEKGKLNWNHSGIVEYNNQWFYVERGRLNWNYTGLGQSGNDWYYIVGGRVNWGYTGLVQKGNEWFYIENGKLNWNHSGIVEYNKQWFYVERGRLNWNYTGLGQSGNDWYYIERGRVNWGYTGLVQKGNEWFYVKGGKLDWSYTGLVQKGNEWFFVRNGRLDWGYTGLACNGEYYFYVKNGRLDWNYSGYAQIDGQGEYYEVRNGRLVGGTLTLAKMHGVANNQDSPTNYIVIVDRAAHRVGVFKGSKYNWADAKYYKCCVGKPSTPTISGTYYIKSRGKYFDTGTKGRCWYFTQINGNYLFHSVIYDRQNSPKRIIDNSMDAAVSHGCVRLDLENAKWIYDNIPKNTKVIIYRSV